ncbi:hypothetical protein ACIGW0_08195 [Streptomyces bikiniensis]|uniref:Uncharacterized protein n=1 Tax=Streptomyces bikiniensis TaxID=1896 RepID=A0ABW8CR90_STRBI
MEMTGRDADRNRRVLERLEALGRQGVVETAGGVPETAPDSTDAFLAMAGFEVVPTRTVPRKDPDARERVDALWHEEADRMGLFGGAGNGAGDRDFLLLVSRSPESPTGGWHRMRDTIGARLPSRIAAATGNQEFVAASLDGRSMCAVSVEEYDDWIITHSFEATE